MQHQIFILRERIAELREQRDEARAEVQDLKQRCRELAQERDELLNELHGAKEATPWDGLPCPKCFNNTYDIFSGECSYCEYGPVIGVRR